MDRPEENSRGGIREFFRSVSQQGIVHSYGNLPLRRKYLLSHIAVVLVAVLVLSPVSYLIARNQVERRTGEFATILLEKSAFIWQTKLREVIDYFIVQFDAHDVGQALKEGSGADQAVRKLRIEKAFSDIATYKEEIRFILVDSVDSRRFFYQRQDQAFLPDELANLVPYNYVLSLRARPVLLTGPNHSILFSKVIYDLQTTEYLGIVTIGLDPDYFSAVFPDGENAALGNLLIIDRFLGRPVVAAPGAEHLMSAYEESLGSGAGAFRAARRNIDGTSYVVGESGTDDGRWLLQSYTAIPDIARLSTLSGLFIAIASAISLLAAIRLSVFIADRETVRILNIKDHAQQIAAGDLTVESRDDHMDELGQLAGAIGDLSHRITGLVEGLASERSRLDEARYSALQSEYSSLQSKINPHFLYNSLEMVNSMAKLKGEDEISEIIQLLGELMRESIRRKNSLIPLGDELASIGKYLKVQEILHDNMLKVTINVSAGAEELYVPNFILQPIVEKAIVHGIEPSHHPGALEIQATLSGADLLLEVSDNGVGMTAERAGEALDQEAADDPKHTKIGLASVDRRIKILYGEASGVTIESRPGEGTRVSVRIPGMKEAAGWQA